MSNQWVNHVKNVANNLHISYKEALQHPETKKTFGGSAKSAGYVRKIEAQNPVRPGAKKLTAAQEREKKVKFVLDKVKNPSQFLINKYSQDPYPQQDQEHPIAIPLRVQEPAPVHIEKPVEKPVHVPLPLQEKEQDGPEEYDDYDAAEYRNYVKERNKSNKVSKADKAKEAEELRLRQQREEKAEQRQQEIDEYNEIKQDAIKYKKAYDTIDNDYSDRLKRLAGDKQFKKAQKEELHEKILVEKANKIQNLKKENKDLFTYMKTHKLEDTNAVHKHVNAALKKLQ